MEELSAATSSTTTNASLLRWRLLRRAFIRRPSDDQSEEETNNINLISRKSARGFNLIPFRVIDNNVRERSNRDVCLCYTVPITGAPQLRLYKRAEDRAVLEDFDICDRYNIDNTGLVCSWPSEDVLAYYCLSHADIFRSKRVIELGSGYGLAGLMIAAFTEASEVVISDGNPQVVDYIQRNINVNSDAFGGKLVMSMVLHWDQRETSDYSNGFDLIVASDCTFFKEFHKGLAQTIKFLLKEASSRALFFSPRRGDSLDKFLVEINESGLHFSITKKYDTEVWRRHQQFTSGNDVWPNYDKDHCYPLLVTITL